MNSFIYADINSGLVLVSVAMFLISSPVAKADAWGNLQLVCKELHTPQIDQFVQAARTWEKNEVGAQGDLTNLADNVCPAYIKNPNAAQSMDAAPTSGTVTLQTYVAEQSRTFTNALNADSKGKTDQAYQFILGELGKIRDKTLGVKTTCPQLAGNTPNTGSQKPAASYGQGSGAPTRAPAGTSSNGQSTITGKITPDMP